MLKYGGKVNSLATFSDSVSGYQKACALNHRSRNTFGTICETYKSFLDANFAGRFCNGDHCKAIFMVEIKYDGAKWGATPKIFYSEAEAEAEAEVLRQRYPWIIECRVVSRKEKEKD